MAKLTHDNLQAKSTAKVSQVDNWNPPITPISKAAAAKTQMLPPQTRPQPKIPITPSHSGRLSSLGSGEQNSSSKKKRRRRGGRRTGDSASEVATTVSEDTTTAFGQGTTPSVRGTSEVLVEASQPTPSSQSKLPPLPLDASAEEKRVYENEPEMYGVYASSEDGDDEKEEEQPMMRPITLPRRERVQTYSPSIANGHAGSSPTRAAQKVASVPGPEKMANGRFKCPFSTEYNCTQTFATARGATRHGDLHVNADRFQCAECGKGFSRKDTFMRHLESHKQRNMEKSSKQATASQVDQARSRKARVETSSTQDKIANSMSNDSDNADDMEGDRIAPSATKDRVRKSDRSGDTRSDHPGATDNDDTDATRDSHHGGNHRVRSQEGYTTNGTEVRSVSTSATHERMAPQNAFSRLSPSQQRNATAVNGLKRKSPSSPRFNRSITIPSRKRMRKGSDPSAKAPQEVTATSKQADMLSDRQNQSPEPSSVESNDAMEQDHVEDSINGSVGRSDTERTPDSDVEMGGSDVEEVEDAKASMDSNSENDSHDEVVQNHAKTSDMDTKFSTKPAPITMRRQSSMDNFVQRSSLVAGSAKASASNSKVMVNVPARSQRIQTRLAPISDNDMSRSNLEDSDSSGNLNDEDPEQQPTTNTKGKGEMKAVGKGKGKAKAQDIRIHASADNSPEQESSEDRPRATSIARRTMSSVPKPAPKKLKPRATPRKRSKVSSGNDESDEANGSQSKKGSVKSRKRHAKTAAGKSEFQDEKKSKPKSGVSVADAPWAEASRSGQTGRFTEEENHILFSWRDSFCNEHNMSTHEFNDMMTNTTSIRKDEWKYGWITKNEFMQQFYDQLPERNRRSMIRFRERHFQNVEKNPWTEAEDKELIQLVTELGTKWVEIGQMMGRTQDSVNQRWRHKLNHGEKPALMGEWTPEEVKQLEEEVASFARLKHTTPDDEDLQIPWLAISKKLGTGRTAQQCSNRWRINTTRRIKGKFVKIPHSDRIPGGKVKQVRTPSKMDKRLSGDNNRKSGKQYKSAERIEDSDADDEGRGSDDSQEVEVGVVKSEDEQERFRENAGQREQDSDQEMDDANSQNLSDQTDDTEQSEEESSLAASSADKSTSSSPLPNTLKSTSGAMQSEQDGSSQANRLPQRGASRSTTHSHSQSSLQNNSLNSSQPSLSKTPAVSRNPLKTASKNQSTPDVGLSMTQLHAGTQANSSAKRTTGRTTRTRVPDSIIAEDRPSPDIGMRRRPIRSSSPSMTPLPDMSRTATGEGTEEESSADESNSDMELDDFKSPATFVSANSRTPLPNSTSNRSANVRDKRSTSEPSAEDPSDSDSTSGSGSDTDAKSDTSEEHDQPTPRASSPQVEPTRWTAVNPISKVLGYMRGASQSQSQSQGSNGTQGRKKGLSLADDLKRRAAGIEDTDSGDD